MKTYSLIGISTLLMTMGFSVMADGINSSTIKLSGFEETPAVLSAGSGTFKAKLDKGNTFLSYTLTYSGLSSPVTAAHIHFGQPGVAGGVIAFLCGGTKPVCPPANGTVSGTIMAADIVAVPAQGIHAGNFSDFLSVLKSGNAYVNVHSTMHPSGEIRGQVRRHLFHDDMIGRN